MLGAFKASQLQRVILGDSKDHQLAFWPDYRGPFACGFAYSFHPHVFPAVIFVCWWSRDTMKLLSIISP